MGSVVEYILDGLEKALELERELGVRAVEIDRGLLADASARLAEDPPREPPHEYMRLPRSDFHLPAYKKLLWADTTYLDFLTAIVRLARELAIRNQSLISS